MSDPSTVVPVVLALLGGGILACLGLTIVAWRRRETPGARGFITFLGTAVFYSCATLAIFLSPTADVAVVSYYLASVGGVAVGVAWTAFVLEYAGYFERLRWWGHFLLWGVPSLYVVALLTNPLHGAVVDAETTGYGSLTLVSPTFEPMGLAQVVYLIALVLGSFALLGNQYLRTRNVHRKQTGAIIAGAIVPVVAYALFWTGFAPHPSLDLTPLAFVAQATIVGWALFRYDFLSVSPIATELYIQQMADPLLVLDERDRLVDSNDAATTILGIDDVDTRPHLRSIAQELAAAVNDDAGTVDLSTPNGPATFDLTETVIRDRHGRVRGTMLVLRDVTELEEHRAELERKNAQLEQFTSVVSHDLRNPLNVAKGFAELARDEDDPAALERSIGAMEDMEDLIADLLTLARDGQTVSDVELVSFADVVEAAWSETPTTGARLVVADDADFECYADPDRFQELLGNLFRNAVEHGTPDRRPSTAETDANTADTGSRAGAGESIDGPTFDESSFARTGVDGAAAESGSDASDEATEQFSLTVTVGRLDGQSGFYVEDDGVGVDDPDRVFESGYTTDDDGTGLGLAIVTSIANGHGWGVSLRNGDAGGARIECNGLRIAGEGGGAA